MSEIKTTLVAGVAWPEVGELPQRFKHAYVKPVRNIGKESHKKRKETDVKFEEWLSKPQPIKKRSIEDGRMAKKST